eukprot:CAMPEP_0177662140 /NCGR_PEP_ID=MMETSP0447-20121125/19106_1 /TAXON_ID=0 /ORGANISM="Stygamoeba regulata, Strain BSH-02190019" /LENGTH=440 /DNA_ID=CAMNT_0019167635 /DNA_START=319 /DNA_END=1638 /DNA_ORIENTATION=+
MTEDRDTHSGWPELVSGQCRYRQVPPSTYGDAFALPWVAQADSTSFTSCKFSVTKDRPVVPLSPSARQLPATLRQECARTSRPPLSEAHIYTPLLRDRTNSLKPLIPGRLPAMPESRDVLIEGWLFVDVARPAAGNPAQAVQYCVLVDTGCDAELHVSESLDESEEFLVVPLDSATEWMVFDVQSIDLPFSFCIKSASVEHPLQITMRAFSGTDAKDWQVALLYVCDKYKSLPPLSLNEMFRLATNLLAHLGAHPNDAPSLIHSYIAMIFSLDSHPVGRLLSLHLDTWQVPFVLYLSNTPDEVSQSLAKLHANDTQAVAPLPPSPTHKLPHVMLFPQLNAHRDSLADSQLYALDDPCPFIHRSVSSPSPSSSVSCSPSPSPPRSSRFTRGDSLDPENSADLRTTIKLDDSDDVNAPTDEDPADMGSDAVAGRPGGGGRDE